MVRGKTDTDSSSRLASGHIAALIDQHGLPTALTESREIEESNLDEISIAEGGRVRLCIAESLYLAGNCKAALCQINLVVEKLKHTGAHSDYGRAKCQRGKVNRAIGDPAGAMDDFREALFAFRRVGDRRGELDACNRYAQCAYFRGQFQKAREYLEDGLRLSEELQDVERCAALSRNLGRVMMLVGDLSAAKSYLLASEPSSVSLVTPVTQCSWHLSMGFLYLLMRQFSEASTHLETASSLAAQHSLQFLTAINHEYTGELAFWRGEKEQAEEHYREAIGIGMAIAPEGPLISQSCRLLAEVQVEQGELAAAEESCDRGWQVAEKINEWLELGAIQRVRGEIAVRRGDAEAAKSAFDESIRILSEIGAKYELARTHVQAGEATVFDPQYRLANLFIARSLFETIGVAYWQERVAAQIDKLIHTDTVVGRNVPKMEGLEGGNITVHDNGSNGHGPFIATSRLMREIIEQVNLVKDTDATILLLGETGAGKDHLARYIHEASNRAGKPFEVICAVNLPDHLWESELFGHTKGCFTGADGDRPGRLELANGGTVYLNEISEIPWTLQAKLLDILEAKEVRRLGGWKTTKLDIRFIAASNQDLRQAISARRFREDLFFRLNQMPITLPPLRQRQSDICALATYFLARCGFSPERTEQLLATGFGEDLKQAPWPGNVRQLQHLLWRLASLSNGSGTDYLVKLGREILADEGLLTDPERDKLIALLSANSWNQRETARQMGISEGAVRMMMKRLGITRPPEA